MTAELVQTIEQGKMIQSSDQDMGLMRREWSLNHD